jgi:hypothetical protein
MGSSKAMPVSSSQIGSEITKSKEAVIRDAIAAQFQYFIIKADSSSYGYSIYANGCLFIRQNTIPAVAGTRGFADTATAAATARLVIQKIKQGEMPPSITIDELKKIKAIQ